jgi:hypothetical protein
MSRYLVSSDKSYEVLKVWVNRQAQLIGNNWFKPELQSEVAKYNAMATALLDYELKTDLFEKDFNAWLLTQEKPKVYAGN